MRLHFIMIHDPFNWIDKIKRCILYIPAIRAAGLLVFAPRSSTSALIRGRVKNWCGSQFLLSGCCRGWLPLMCILLVGDVQHLCYTLGQKDNRTKCLFIHVGLGYRYLVIMYNMCRYADMRCNVNLDYCRNSLLFCAHSNSGGSRQDLS